MEAVCTSATITGLVVSEVMTQAAVTSFIHIATLAANVASHRLRKTVVRNGAKVELCAKRRSKEDSAKTGTARCRAASCR